ncbi:3-phosphoinositide-dependent protein kinase 2 [Nymphaea thermarum]|nr:3-phosphoinositide-dependent protein kinase 2 [Nymphaea thermarum]
MEREFEQKVGLNTGSRHESCNGSTRSRNFAFRAPQENFTINDFELGKFYGVGSYSKSGDRHSDERTRNVWSSLGKCMRKGCGTTAIGKSSEGTTSGILTSVELTS